MARQVLLPVVLFGLLSSTSAGVQDGQVYRIVSAKSGKALYEKEMPGDWDKVEQRSFEWREPLANNRQLWRVVRYGNEYELRNTATETCYDVSDHRTNNGVHLISWKCHGGANQRFRFVHRGDGRYMIIAQHSQKCSRVLTKAEGEDVRQWSCGRSTDYLWYFKPVVQATYKGCYTDKSTSRDFEVSAPRSLASKMSVETCRDYCLHDAPGAPFRFMGLQNGQECYCSNTYGKHGSAPDVLCRSHCKGDGNDYCGGYKWNSVYEVAEGSAVVTDAPATLAPPTPAPATPAPLPQEVEITDGQVYRILSVKSGKALYEKEMSGNWDKVEQRAFDWRDEDVYTRQLWKVVQYGNEYELRNMETGTCYDVSDHRTNNGVHLISWKCHGGANQRFRFVRRGLGQFMIVAQHSQKCSRVLTKAEGEDVRQWSCGRSSGYLWSFQPMPALEYKGCYADKSTSRDFEVSAPRSLASKMSVETCRDYCLHDAPGAPFRFMGLQNGQECYCSNTYGKHGSRPDYYCRYHCKGDGNDYCGGAYKNSVYEITLGTTSAPATVAPSTSAPRTDAPPTNAPRTSAPATNAPPTDAPATSAPPTSAPPTNAPPTSAPPTNAPPTSAPATDAPATNAPPTDAPATNAPPTSAPPTDAPPTSAPPTNAPPTSAPATDAPATNAPPTDAPATSAPPTNAPPTSAPPTDAPATNAPPTSAPPTPAPVPVTTVRVFSGSHVTEGSVGIFAFTLVTFDGQRLPMDDVAYPQSGSMRELSLEGVAPEDVREVIITATHQDGWYVAGVHLLEGQAWSRLVLPHYRDQEGHWIDGDNAERTPQNLYFSRLQVSQPDGDNTLFLRVKTAGGSADGADGQFPVRLHSVNGTFYDVLEMFVAPQAGQTQILEIQMSPFALAEIKDIELSDSEVVAGGGWRIESLEAGTALSDMGRWVLPEHDHADGHLLDRTTGGENAPKVLWFERLATPAPGAAALLHLRVTTGSGVHQGSVDTFPVLIKSTAGVFFEAEVTAPLSAEVRTESFIVPLASVDDVEWVKLVSEGSDNWFVSKVEVKSAAGEWVQLLLREHNYAASRWLCSGCNGMAAELLYARHPVFVVEVPPAPAAAGNNVVRVRFTSSVGSANTFAIGIQSKDGTFYSVDSVVAPNTGSPTIIETTTSPFPREDVRAVWVTNGGSDGWQLSVDVETADGQFSQWFWNGRPLQWIDGDSAVTPRVLLWTP